MAIDNPHKALLEVWAAAIVTISTTLSETSCTRQINNDAHSDHKIEEENKTVVQAGYSYDPGSCGVEPTCASPIRLIISLPLVFKIDYNTKVDHIKECWQNIEEPSANPGDSQQNKYTG